MALVTKTELKLYANHSKTQDGRDVLRGTVSIANFLEYAEYCKSQGWDLATGYLERHERKDTGAEFFVFKFEKGFKGDPNYKKSSK